MKFIRINLAKCLSDCANEIRRINHLLVPHSENNPLLGNLAWQLKRTLLSWLKS